MLLFIVLEFFVLRYYLRSTPYTRAKQTILSAKIVGGLDAKAEGVKSFFNMYRENYLLSEELARVKNELEAYRQVYGNSKDSVVDQIGLPYVYMSGAVVNNTISSRHNYFTVDRGLKDSVYRDMAVVCGRNIVGYVVESSEDFSVCISLLNMDFRTSARIEGEEYTGIVSWDGLNREYLTLSDVPKYADLAIGDTVVTTNYSAIFPAGLVIGTISEFELENMTSYRAKIKIAAKMGALNNVSLIFNRDAEQRSKLEEAYFK